MLRLVQIVALQTGDDGVFLPEGGGSTVVWIIFAAVIAGLYLIVSRSRRRADDAYWDRKRRETEPLPEPDDPTELP